MQSKITPWQLGLVSTLMGVLRVQDSSIPYQGRLALILLDTVFETACFVYLRHVRGWKLGQLGTLSDLRSRVQLFDQVKAVASVSPDIWERIDECHRERNERAHFDPNKDIAERFVRDYFETAVRFINTLFSISLDEAVLRLEGGLYQAAEPLEVKPAGPIPVGAADELAKATHLYYLGDFTGAMNAASKVAEQFDLPHAHYLLALCLRKAGPQHWDRAVDSLAGAIQRPPLNSDPRAYLEYADLLLRCNRAADSVQVMEAGFKIGLEEIRGREAFGLYGDALRAICRFRDAVSAYKSSLTHDPTYQRGNQGLVETLLTLGLANEAMDGGKAAVARGPHNSSYRVLLARAYSAQKEYSKALALLDEAWELSIEKGGQGDNRVLWARASVFFAEYTDQPPDSDAAAAALARAKNDVRTSLDSPSVRPSFRPTFRHFLADILWREGEFEKAYQQTRQGTRENKYQERNFAYLAVACLSTARWHEAKLASIRGMTLARQVVVWSIWCELFMLLAGVFLDGPTTENSRLLKNWTDRLSTFPEFEPQKFDWSVPRKTIEASAEQLPAAGQSIVSKALAALDAHPSPK